MKILKKKHLYFLLISIVSYALFIVRGLSTNHFNNLNLDFYFVESVDIFIFFIPIAYFILKLISNKKDYFKDSLWLAFYFTVPFFLFDYIFLGLIKGHGFGYLLDWWFLTIFYFIFWFEFPIVGYLMKMDNRKEEKKHIAMTVISVIFYLLIYWGGSFSNHYLEWNQDMKIMRLLNIPLMLWFITYAFLKHYSEKESYFKDALFLSLHMSFYFIMIDFQFLAIYKNVGFNYITDYWFIVLFYPIFWITIPVVGKLMQRSFSK